jgi:hypothetical protein
LAKSTVNRTSVLIVSTDAQFAADPINKSDG